MNMGSGSMGAMNMGSGMAVDLNDIDYDAFLANDRTLADPEVIRTEPGGRVQLRLINAASATQFWIEPICQMPTYPRRPFAVSLAGIASNDRSLRARAP
jgi:hypothetical protein